MELIAVTGVTAAALLLALLPIYRSPHPGAERMTCLYQHKQMVTALALYTQDWDWRLPSVGTPVQPTSQGLETLLLPYTKTLNVWRCRKDTQPDKKEPSTGYNWLGLQNGGQGALLARIADPAGTVALVEAPGRFATPAVLAPMAGGMPPVARHEGRMNVGWLDGHAKSTPAIEVEERLDHFDGTATGMSIEWYRYWNRTREGDAYGGAR